MSLDALLSFTLTCMPFQTLSSALTQIRLYQWYALDATVVCTIVWVLLRWIRSSRQRVRTTQLRGPPSESFLYGVGKRALNEDDAGAVYEEWARKYGLVYSTPWTLGTSRILLCDPKAVAHYHANETWTYVFTPFEKQITALVGKGLTWSQGEDHRRQRKSLAPGFSMASIRQLTSVFYDSAYNAKGSWDSIIESNGGGSAIIDVQNWMNHISLDTIGLAGFSHNFGALEGKRAEVTEIFDELGTGPKRKMAVITDIFLLGFIFPFISRLPTSRRRLIKKLNIAMEQISNLLLARATKEMEMDGRGGKDEKSIIELLIEGASGDSNYHLSQEEVMAQMKVLLVAGYETTSITMTWALLELARNPEMQTRLRNELLQHGRDPTYDELTHGLPYLDAVVHEILRLRSPITQFTRMANQDDVIPLSEPIRTKSGELVDHLTIAKGTLIGIPVEMMNRSAALWGEDAKMFRPSRWLEESADKGGIPAKAREIHGHRHLLTFSDGPRTCLGKYFALTEFKAVMSVLVKNFVFEMRDSVDAKIEMRRGVLPRPMLAGEDGCKIPLRVRPYVP